MTYDTQVETPVSHVLTNEHVQRVLTEGLEALHRVDAHNYAQQAAKAILAETFTWFQQLAFSSNTHPGFSGLGLQEALAHAENLLTTGTLPELNYKTLFAAFTR